MAAETLPVPQPDILEQRKPAENDPMSPFLQPLTPYQVEVFEDLRKKSLSKVGRMTVLPGFINVLFDARIQGKTITFQDFLLLHDSIAPKRKGSDDQKRQATTRARVGALRKHLRPDAYLIMAGDGYTVISPEEFHKLQEMSQNYVTLTHVINLYKEDHPEINLDSARQKLYYLLGTNKSLIEDLGLTRRVNPEDAREKWQVNPDSVEKVFQLLDRVNTQSNNKASHDTEIPEKTNKQILEDIETDGINILLMKLSKGKMDEVDNDLFVFLGPHFKKHKKAIKPDREEAFKSHFLRALRARLGVYWSITDRVAEIRDPVQRQNVQSCLHFKANGKTIESILETVSKHFSI